MVTSKFATPTPMYQFHRLNYFIAWQKINMKKCSFLMIFFLKFGLFRSKIRIPRSSNNGGMFPFVITSHVCLYIWAF